MSFRMALRPLMVCTALFVFGHAASAQNKVAIVNLQKAVMDSAEIKAASAAMEARYKPRVAQIEALDTEIAAIAQNLQTNAGKLTAQAGTQRDFTEERAEDDGRSEEAVGRQGPRHGSGRPVRPLFQGFAGYHARPGGGVRQGISGSCSSAQEVSHNR